MLPAQPNRSLIDGLAVLQAVSAARTELGSRELARSLSLEPTRVNRLLKTLAAIGLLEQSASRRYRPGPGLHVLSATALFGSRLIARASGPVEALRQKVPGLTVALGVRWRTDVAYLLFAPPEVPLVQAVGRTALYPALKSSIGRVLLAAADEDEIARLYPTDLPAINPILSDVRRQQFSLITSEPEPTLAVPVGTPATSALAVAGPFTPDQVESLLTPLRHAAHQIASTEPSQEPS